ncbi:MAG TPA: 5'-methylthioadenosine/S-adenosylhomocysteine nucleosidase [Piscirickettsiaceae bacterium]|nr:5'-methylthioadenosine/S-adenosylhomocysteine nucleosidase [Piscirickettsiaceae bacterium]
MKVGIIGAMEQEVTLLRDQIDGLHTQRKAGFEFYTGHLAGHEVVLLRCGIGKVNAAIGTTLLLDNFSPEAVINTGSAGGFDPALKVGDLIIGDKVCHHDVDVTPFGYAPGQVPGLPTCFIADPALIQVAETAAADLEGLAHKRGLIASGDRFMHQPDDVERVRARFPAMLAAEMEAAAIAQACHLFNTPFVIIRALSDIAGQENAITFEQFLDTAARHAAQLILKMLQQLPKQTD